MSAREQLRMSDAEVAAFLADGRRAQVATCGADGWPHIVPLSYFVVDGQPVLWTDGASQKVANLRRDPRISVLVEVGNAVDEFRAVLLRGFAEVDDDHQRSAEAGRRLFQRYSPQPLSGEVLAYVDALAHQRVVVTVRVDSCVSWDHRKMPVDLQQVGR